MQSYRFPDLLQHKLAVGFMFGRSHTLGAAGNLNGVTIHNPNALQELSKSQLKPVVETPQDGRVAMILFARSVEVKYFLHGTSSTELIPYFILPDGSRPVLRNGVRCYSLPGHDKIIRTRLLRSYP